MRTRLPVVLALALAVSCAKEQPRPHLDSAIAIANWLRTTVIDTEHGPVWPDDHLRPEVTTMGLGSGVAGRVLFFLALRDQSGDEQYLDDVRIGADYMLKRLPSYLKDTTEQHTIASLYNGLPGIAFALNKAHKATHDSRYRDGALTCLNELHRLARRDNDGVTWNERHDILNGSAGTGLFLLYAAKEMDHKPSLELAALAGDWLIAHSELKARGLTWTAGADMDIILPNFSHGGAGIGMFLAALSEATGEKEFENSAIAAAEYLKSITTPHDSLFLVPYGIPNVGFTRPHDVGWAHGPAGTARLFYELWRITADTAWMDLTRQCAYTVLHSGMPGVPAPEFGEVPFKKDMRFGTASAAMFLLDLGAITGDQSYISFARRLTADIASLAVRDSLTMHWQMPRYEFMPNPNEPAQFTGYFYGAAGYGLLFLRLDAATRHKDWRHTFPDNPFHPVRR
jgi:lantibiotic modifying enzyme